MAETEEPLAVTLNELFARDPLELSNANVAEIVDAIRANKAKFSSAEVRAKAEGRKIRPSEGMKLADLGAISIDDIFKS